jgi:hypothetical protein
MFPTLLNFCYALNESTASFAPIMDRNFWADKRLLNALILEYDDLAAFAFCYPLHPKK